MYAFFCSDLGRRLISGAECLREFKFSILDDACAYADGLEDEIVLLQGVVDCAILDDDGITVLDFKTDYVTADTVCDVTKKYTLQVKTYCDALSRIFELPVKDAYIYYFSMDQFDRV